MEGYEGRCFTDVRSLNIEGITDELAEKLNKCIYIREVKEFSETTEIGQGDELMMEVVSLEGAMVEIRQSAGANRGNEQCDGFGNG